jgi:hypothetical protein
LHGQVRLPFDALAGAARHLVLGLLAVVVADDDQHELRGRELVDHPARPALLGVVDELIDDRIDAVATQRLRQREHPLLVSVGVLAVADEHPRHRSTLSTTALAGLYARPRL